MQLSTLLNGAPEVSIEGDVAADGAVIFPDALDQSFIWNGDGTLSYIEVNVPPMAGTTYAGGIYRQSFTWSGGKLQSVSKWTKRP